MFWKEKNSDKDLIEYESPNRRASYRYHVNEPVPVVFRFGHQRVALIELSAGGLSFKKEGYYIGESHPIEIILPGKRMTKITAVLEVVAIVNKSECHCSFTKIEEEVVESIHKYILEKQKDALRNQKKELKKKKLFKMFKGL